MAITRTNIQEIDTGATPAASLTLSSYTPSTGSNRVLEVAIACGRTVPPTCSVTFGGVTMTQRAFIESDGSSAVAVGMYTLNETDWPSTPSDIVATLNGTGGIRIVASTLTNVDQTTPMDTTPVTVQMGLNVQPWSIDITTATHGALVSVFGAGNDPRTLGALGSNQTQIQYDTDVVEVTTNDISRTLLWEYTDVTSPTSVTMTAAWNSGHARAALAAVAYRRAPILPRIQYGTKDFPNGATSMTIVRGVDDGFNTSVDASKTIMMMSAYTSAPDANNPAYYSLVWELSDADTITITRATATSGTELVNVRWELITFDYGVVVQHKFFSFTSGQLSGSASIDAPSLDGGRWIITKGVTCTTVAPERRAIRWKFDSDTQISATRWESGTAITTACQVVEYSAASVQTIEGTLTATTASTENVAISSVSPNKSAIFGTMYVATDGASNTNTHWNMNFTSPTNIELTRFGTGNVDIVYTIFIVSFNDNTIVQHSSLASSGGNTLQAFGVPISNVPRSSTMVSLKNLMQLYYGSGPSGQNWPFPAQIELKNESTVQIQYVKTSNTVRQEIQAITFGGKKRPQTKLLMSLTGKTPVQFGSGPNIIILS